MDCNLVNFQGTFGSLPAAAVFEMTKMVYGVQQVAYDPERDFGLWRLYDTNSIDKVMRWCQCVLRFHLLMAWFCSCVFVC